VVEEVLREHLRGRPGTELRLGHAVTALAQDSDGVTVAARDAAGTGYPIRARYVLGCDGASGVVRGQAGARYLGRSDSRPNFNLVFGAPGLDPHLGPAVQYWVVGAAVTGLIGRLDLSGTWWAIVPGMEATYGWAHAAELITGLVGAPVEHQVLATDPWMARMLIADRFSDRRVFLVGESAHVNPPWGGHGFNTSVGDAVNIAWKIAAVTRGWATEELLASYEPERRAVAERTVASAEANMAAGADVLPRDAAAIQRAKRAEFHSLGLVLGYSYAGSPIIQPGPAGPGPDLDVSSYTPDTRPGARLPHHWLPDGSSLYDRLGHGFTLVGPGLERHPGVAALAGRARRRGIPLALTEAPPAYPWRGEFLLVRPDQHIAWRAADPADLDIETAAGLRPVRAGV
jgi:FAD binding domain